ncbi:MAG: lipopolysaccharide heptosyltransferase II [Planctomycetes bacterium]|nr:lipopolysaccharide heptosyltransferase II [Planctomycetota bacterium]
MKVLAIGNNWLGDAVMSLPSLYAIRRTLNATIWVITNSYLKDVYSLFDWINKTAIKQEGLIKKERFDHIIVFPRSFSSAILALRFNSKSRIGYTNSIRSLFFTRRISRNDIVKRIHRVDYYFKLASSLGASPPPTLPPIDKLDTNISSSDYTNKIILCPGAKYGDAKMWPARYFTELGNLILKQTGLNTIIIGTQGESKLCDSISKEIPDSINLCGKTTLHDLIAIFKGAKILISNDTGSMHLASLTKIPILAIFGSTNPLLTSPFRQENVNIIKEEIECSPCQKRICPLKHHLCMENIKPQQVFMKALSFIK